MILSEVICYKEEIISVILENKGRAIHSVSISRKMDDKKKKNRNIKRIKQEETCGVIRIVYDSVRD